MLRTRPGFVLLAALLVASLLALGGSRPVAAQAAAQAAAQTPNEIIKRDAATPIATDVTFPVSKTHIYKIAWGVNVGPEKPEDIVPGFKATANHLFVGDANGVPRANQQLAVVIWGTATHSLLTNDAYKAAKGVDNGSAALLKALHESGVQIIVCGEALINRKIDRKDLLPFVKIAPTASYALATLHTQGYATWLP